MNQVQLLVGDLHTCMLSDGIIYDVITGHEDAYVNNNRFSAKLYDAQFRNTRGRINPYPTPTLHVRVMKTDVHGRGLTRATSVSRKRLNK